MRASLPAWIHAFASPTVEAFYADRGFDSFGPGYFDIWPGTIEEQAVVAEDPLRVRVTVDVDGDGLVVTLDDEGRVLDVTDSG